MKKGDAESGCDRDNLYQVLNEEFIKAASQQNPLTLMFIKLIHLDQIGRSYGSHTALHLFHEIKRLVCENIRRDDRSLAHGNDELVIILPNTPRDGTSRIVSKLKRLVESFSFTNGSGAQVTLKPQFGIASYFPSSSQWLER